MAHHKARILGQCGFDFFEGIEKIAIQQRERFVVPREGLGVPEETGTSRISVSGIVLLRCFCRLPGRTKSTSST